MATRRVFGIAVIVWALALSYSVRALPQTPPPAAPAAVSADAPAAAQTNPANADCYMCHEDDSAARASGSPVVVKPAIFDQSIHGGLACIDCHQDLQKAEMPHPEKLAKVDCATCHSDAMDQYKKSAHSKARATGSAYAAACADCHGTHDIKPKSDPASATHHLKIAATCARCHGNAEIIAKGGIPHDVTRDFADSIHGTVLAKSGLMVAPTCSDCHGAHDILKPKDPQSPVAMVNVPSTCGKCHEGLANQFKAGVHGRLLAAGKTDGPACQTCHTAHSIPRADKPAFQLGVVGQCGTCHAERVASFRDTFHGQVTQLGFRSVAACADCHGAHEVLPASDPRSPIHKANLVKTCGKCHENASENFVKYDPHADKHDRDRSPALYYTSKFMTVLLFAVFSTFGLHTTFWFTREIHLRRERKRAAARKGKS